MSSQRSNEENKKEKREKHKGCEETKMSKVVARVERERERERESYI